MFDPQRAVEVTADRRKVNKLLTIDTEVHGGRQYPSPVKGCDRSQFGRFFCNRSANHEPSASGSTPGSGPPTPRPGSDPGSGTAPESSSSRYGRGGGKSTASPPASQCQCPAVQSRSKFRHPMENTTMVAGRGCAT